LRGAIAPRLAVVLASLAMTLTFAMRASRDIVENWAVVAPIAGEIVLLLLASMTLAAGLVAVRTRRHA
jgi:hypothetical protein